MPKKPPVLTLRADYPWLTAIDDLAIQLKLGNRSRVVEVALELLVLMAGAPMLPPRIPNPENPVTERFTRADRDSLLRNASTLITQ